MFLQACCALFIMGIFVCLYALDNCVLVGVIEVSFRGLLKLHGDFDLGLVCLLRSCIDVHRFAVCYAAFKSRLSLVLDVKCIDMMDLR